MLDIDEHASPGLQKSMRNLCRSSNWRSLSIKPLNNILSYVWFGKLNNSALKKTKIQEENIQSKWTWHQTLVQNEHKCPAIIVTWIWGPTSFFLCWGFFCPPPLYFIRKALGNARTGCFTSLLDYLYTRKLSGSLCLWKFWHTMLH